MMKGPATLAEIAGASGMPVADVADFVNASLATGFADIAPNTPPDPAEPAKPTAPFGRLRGTEPARSGAPSAPSPARCHLVPPPGRHSHGREGPFAFPHH